MARERERIREKEMEPVPMAGRDWNTRINREEERKYFANLPRVFKCSDSPKAVSYSWAGEETDEWRKGSVVAVHLKWYRRAYEQMKAPIYTIACLGGRAGGHEGGIVVKEGAAWPPTNLLGKHRHFFEAAFYVPPGGKVFEFQDGVTWEFSGEGILCVPTYTSHMHWYWKVPPGGMTFQSRTYEYIGVSDFEAFQFNKKWVEAMAKDGKLPEWLPLRYEHLERFMTTLRQERRWDEGEPKTIYDRFRKRLVDQNLHRLRSPRWHTAEVPYENTRMGRIKYLVHPWVESCLNTFNVFMQEIPPGGASGKHRHLGEEVHYVIKGRGYDIQDGVKYDWGEDDIVCIPVATTHQHFNADPKNPAVFVSAETRWYDAIGYGGIQHLEDAPDWEG